MPGIRKANAAGALLAALAAIVIAPLPAAAQADFYKGRTIELIVSTGVGGGLDANARVVARHLVNHVPGQPTIVVKNMPGAGHIRAANYVFTQAPKDGTTIATFIPVFVMAQVLERSRSIQFNPAQFNWLASTSSSNSTVYVWHTSGIKSVEDATRRTVVMGATGAGSYTIIYPTVMNSLIGTRFKLVTGYQSTAEVGLAMERGEIEGRTTGISSVKSNKPEWLKPDGIMQILVVMGRKTRYPELPNVPTARELAKTDNDRALIEVLELPYAMSRPFAAPPGVPKDRAAALVKAFMETHKDPAYLKDAEKLKVDVSPIDGDDVRARIESIAKVPPDVMKGVEKLITSN
jgi:tripartite-type tricarboxylate transporter receptor subunit TctC